MTHSFANVLYLSICMLGNCSCFYFRQLTFFKIKFSKNKQPRTTIGVSNSLDTGQDQHSVGLHLGSNVLRKAIGRRQNYPLCMQRVIAGKYFSVQYIVSYRDIHVYVYHKYSDTLNTFNMLYPLKQSKSNIQRI